MELTIINKDENKEFLNLDINICVRHEEVLHLQGVLQSLGLTIEGLKKALDQTDIDLSRIEVPKNPLVYGFLVNTVNDLKRKGVI